MFTRTVEVGGDSEKMCANGPVGQFSAYQTQIKFVDQCRRLQCLCCVFVAQIPVSKATQLLIYERGPAVECLASNPAKAW
jgi:hypothetical protein